MCYLIMACVWYSLTHSLTHSHTHSLTQVASTIAWTLYSLAMYRSERTSLETAMTDSSSPESSKRVNAFMKEVFRMFPPATFYSGTRTVENDYFRVKGGIDIPKNTVCHLVSHSLTHSLTHLLAHLLTHSLTHSGHVLLSQQNTRTRLMGRPAHIQ